MSALPPVPPMQPFQPVGATDAVSLAIARWKRLLFANLSMGRLLKLSFVALLAEASGGFGFNGNFRTPTKGLDKMGSLPAVVHAGLITFFIAAAIIGIVIGIVILYLGCRMKFAEFHIAATGDTRVGPPWRAYGPQTWRLFWTTLAIDLTGLAVLAAIGLPMVLAFMHRNSFGDSPSLRQVFAILLVVLPILLVVALALQFALMVVRDLMLPVWALQNASVGQSWTVARSIIEREPGEFAIYAVVKIVMHIVLAILGFLAFAATLLISAIPFAAVGFAIYVSLHAHGLLLMIFLFVLEGAVAFVWIAVLSCICFGAPALMYQCYAAEWLAPRYPPLAHLMYPRLPPSQPSPPLSPVLPPIPSSPTSAGGEDWTTTLG